MSNIYWCYEGGSLDTEPTLHKRTVIFITQSMQCKFELFFTHLSQLFFLAWLEFPVRCVWSDLCSVVSFVMYVCVRVYIYKYISPYFRFFHFELQKFLMPTAPSVCLLQYAERLSSSRCVELGTEPCKPCASKPACDLIAVLQF